VAIVRAGDLASRNRVLGAFLVSAAAIAAINGVAMPWLMPEYTMPVGIQFDRATGLMQNANAYGFFLVVVMLLAIAMRYRLWLCVPAYLLSLWFTSSRGALIALVAGIAVLLALSPRRMMVPLKPMALALLLIGLISILAGLVDQHRVSAALEGFGPIGYLSAERVDPESNSIAQRWRQTAGAIELIAEAPVFGHGLGYVLKTTGQTIHNSLLWLVVETGFVGAAVFTVFLVLAVRQLFLDRDDPFVLGMVAVSGAFVVMSLTGEYLYQRHLWFLLGMALAQTPDQQVAA
jgi:O-antigen ligase